MCTGVWREATIEFSDEKSLKIHSHHHFSYPALVNSNLGSVLSHTFGEENIAMSRNK